MTNKLLTLFYKGSRDYLHGTDFFNVLTEAAPEITGCPNAYLERLVFRHHACRTCELALSMPNDMESIIGQARFMILPEKIRVDAWLVETDKPVTGRRKYDESLILDKARLDQEQSTVFLGSKSKYTPIEDIITLTRYLNDSVSPQAGRKWQFGQLDLDEALKDDYQTLEIRMSKLIASQFSMNDIVMDGRKIGCVRFISGAF